MAERARPLRYFRSLMALTPYRRKRGAERARLRALTPYRTRRSRGGGRLKSRRRAEGLTCIPEKTFVVDAAPYKPESADPRQAQG